MGNPRTTTCGLMGSAHEYQLHPESDDFGVCSVCGHEMEAPDPRVLLLRVLHDPQTLEAMAEAFVARAKETQPIFDAGDIETWARKRTEWLMAGVLDALSHVFQGAGLTTTDEETG